MDHLQLKDMVILCGAGISFDAPSNIPTANSFCLESYRAIAERTRIQLAETFKIELDLPTFLGIQNPMDFCRFEKYFEIYARHIDPEIHYVKSIIQSGDPNELHYGLAKMISEGAAVLTTNFDTKIEDAYESLYSKPLSKVVFESIDVFPRSVDEAKYIKLHGDFSIDRTSLIKLNDIHRCGYFYNENSQWFSNLRSILADKTLIVIGYSGSDDFDIMPLLNDTSTKEVIWIMHSWNGSPDLDGKSRIESKLANQDVNIVLGDTRNILVNSFPNCFDLNSGLYKEDAQYKKYNSPSDCKLFNLLRFLHELHFCCHEYSFFPLSRTMAKIGLSENFYDEYLFHEMEISVRLRNEMHMACIHYYFNFVFPERTPRLNAIIKQSCDVLGLLELKKILDHDSDSENAVKPDTITDSANSIISKFLEDGNSDEFIINSVNYLVFNQNILRIEPEWKMLRFSNFVSKELNRDRFRWLLLQNCLALSIENQVFVNQSDFPDTPIKLPSNVNPVPLVLFFYKKRDVFKRRWLIEIRRYLRGYFQFPLGIVYTLPLTSVLYFLNEISLCEKRKQKIYHAIIEIFYKNSNNYVQTITIQILKEEVSEEQVKILTYLLIETEGVVSALDSLDFLNKEYYFFTPKVRCRLEETVKRVSAFIDKRKNIDGIVQKLIELINSKKRGQHEECLRELFKLESLTQGFLRFEIYEEIADNFISLRKIDMAEQYLEKIPDGYKTCNAVYLTGFIHMIKREINKALRKFLKIYGIHSSGEVEINRNIFYCYFLLERYEEALQVASDFKKSIQSDSFWGADVIEVIQASDLSRTEKQALISRLIDPIGPAIGEQTVDVIKLIRDEGNLVFGVQHRIIESILQKNS